MADCTKIINKNNLEAIALKKSISFDLGQITVSKYLDLLLKEINNLDRNSSIFKFFSNVKKKNIKGVYIFGGVGRGKSMIMDLFFQNVEIKDKRRLHFHDFMREVHQRILKKSKVEKNKDSVLLVGKDLAKSAKLLCFDEMEVSFGWSCTTAKSFASRW